MTHCAPPLAGFVQLDLRHPQVEQLLVRMLHIPEHLLVASMHSLLMSWRFEPVAHYHGA